MSVTELDNLLRDSIAMENAKTVRELDYVCRNIEARHTVEGISAIDREAYDRIKAQHAKRVFRVIAA